MYHAVPTGLYGFSSKDFFKQMLPFHERGLWVLFHREQIMLFLTLHLGGTKSSFSDVGFSIGILATMYIGIGIYPPNSIFSLPKNLF